MLFINYLTLRLNLRELAIYRACLVYNLVSTQLMFLACYFFTLLIQQLKVFCLCEITYTTLFSTCQTLFSFFFIFFYFFKKPLIFKKNIVKLTIIKYQENTILSKKNQIKILICFLSKSNSSALINNFDNFS